MCFLADLRPRSSANKEQRPTIWESKNFTWPNIVSVIALDEPTAGVRGPYTVKLLDRASPRPQHREQAHLARPCVGPNDDEIRFAADNLKLLSRQSTPRVR